MGLADYLISPILQKTKYARLCVFLLVWNMKRVVKANFTTQS